MIVPLWFEFSALGILAIIMAADLVIASRRPRVPSVAESAIWIAFYVGLAIVFGVVLVAWGFPDKAVQFVTGWATEYSLSIDNLFVFVVILARFAVPALLQQRLLMVGIVIALVLRGIFIFVGAVLVSNFSWIFYIFGAFLIYTAIAQLRSSANEELDQDGRIMRFFKRWFRMSGTFDRARLRTRIDGRIVFTPVLVVVAVIGVTDLLFALDSIPAIFGITSDGFVLLTTNIFALMGLRQLYFLLGALVDRLPYLTYGVAAILAFIGLKLVFASLHDNTVPFVNGGRGVRWAPVIGTVESLVVILGLLLLAIVASLVGLRVTRPRSVD
ncbi:MAG: tellurite resistance protein TerC [Actinomycetota bacterium]|jgi:tellurite resistance protein TerC|nr:tellurite resistance protein TerC [Actinomycetota bacterium]